MKNLTFSLTLLLLAAATSTFAQLKFNPKIGLNFSRLSSDPEALESHARIGIALGTDLRIGNRVYLQPGIHYFGISYDLVDLNNPPADQMEEKTTVSMLKVPINVGFNLINSDIFALRIFGGPSAYFGFKVSDNNLGLEKEDFESTVFAANIGAGIDLWFITLDAYLESGLSPLFKDQDDVKHSLFNMALGLRF